MGIRIIILLMFSTILTGCWPFDSDDSTNPPPVTYSAEFSEPSPPNLYSCDGTITLPKVLNLCKNNSGQVVDNTNCSNIPIPKVIFKSPVGYQVDPLVNDNIEIIGDRTFSCDEGKNRVQSEVIVSCTDDRYKLKGEANQRESFCKHFPVNMQLTTNLTCIEFSDKFYECTGTGLNYFLNRSFLDPNYRYWEAEETNYLRSISYFNGSENLRVSSGVSFSIKNGKTYVFEDGSSYVLGNNNLEFFDIKAGDQGNNQSSNGLNNFICYITLDRTLKCKGDGLSFGMENYNSSNYIDIPNLTDLNKLFVSNNTCVQKLDGTVFCAGFYQPSVGLGPPSNPPRYLFSFTEVPEFLGVKDLILDWRGICGIMPGGKVLCSGNYGMDKIPTEVVKFYGMSQIVLGEKFFCGLKENKVYCYYYHNFTGLITENNEPQEILEFRGARKIFVTKFAIYPTPERDVSNFCGIMENNNVKCSGSNYNGQLGTGDLIDHFDDSVILWEF